MQTKLTSPSNLLFSKQSRHQIPVYTETFDFLDQISLKNENRYNTEKK